VPAEEVAMKVRTLAAALTLVSLLALGAGSAIAHQPVLVDSEATEVFEPEISKAYFGKLMGEPHTYRIDSAVEFDLYVGILVPEDGSPKKDVAAEIFAGTQPMAAIGGAGADWVTFYEPFGQNTYWDGGEYRTRAPAGAYTIKISSPDNQSKYSLAIGEIEFFDLEDRANALVVLPEIQREFFGTSPVEMVGTRFGIFNLVVILGAALVSSLLYRLLLRNTLVRLVGERLRHIGWGYRVTTAIALFGWAIATSWSPVVLFLSGLTLFEALLSRFGVAGSEKVASARPR
jgi:hypothetical protein